MNDYENAFATIKRVSDDRLGDYEVYVPHKLPPSIDWNDEKLLYLHYIATHKVSKLSGSCLQLPNPNMLITPYMNREAVLSSQIEGTRVSLSELLLSEAQGTIESMDKREVFNYIVAIQYALDKIRSGPITTELILKMHELLMRGVRGQDKHPGEYRHIQNWIGTPTSNIQDATFVPPDPKEVGRLMEDLVDYINTNDDSLPLVKCALMHYQFETIHPFCDGNGRIGRALITLYLCKSGIIENPILYLSGFFNEYRREYLRILKETNKNATFKEWLLFFFEGVRTQADDALARSRSLQQLREGYRVKLQDGGLSPNHIKLVDHLFYNPYTTIKGAAEYLHVTYPTAKSVVDALQESDILMLSTSKGRSKVYVAHEILRLIE